MRQCLLGCCGCGCIVGIHNGQIARLAQGGVALAQGIGQSCRQFGQGGQVGPLRLPLSTHMVDIHPRQEQVTALLTLRCLGQFERLAVVGDRQVGGTLCCRLPPN